MSIQTVLGSIASQELGFTLPHEHILCDFIGAQKTGRDRWQVSEVVQAIKPKLLQLKQRGITGFVDCTPAYIGRDPCVLKILAEETGLHILTNTGYYGGAHDQFVPEHAYRETDQQLADRWMKEWEEGIEETGIKPGHIKIGVDEIPAEALHLSEIDAKLVRAAALASRQTGITNKHERFLLLKRENGQRKRRQGIGRESGLVSTEGVIPRNSGGVKITAT